MVVRQGIALIGNERQTSEQALDRQDDSRGCHCWLAPIVSGKIFNNPSCALGLNRAQCAHDHKSTC